MKKLNSYSIWIGLVVLFIIVYLIADRLLFDGVKPRGINESGIQANYFAKNTTKQKATIILIGGGQWGDYWGRQFAEIGFSGLSLPYTGKEGLPTLPEEINLEYFENALNWLKQQPEVDSSKIVLMGASRNAELALLIASLFPERVHGVIAYAPSAVLWSNTVLPYNSNDLKASWKYKDLDLPYIPMEKISGNESNKIETLTYWKRGLAKTEYLNQATIQVEKITGPILLFSGKDDKVWPSSIMADMIEERIKKSNYSYAFQNIQYENAGHLISGNPGSKSTVRTGKINIAEKDYEFEFGGTIEGDDKAQLDAKTRLTLFIQNL